MPEQIETESEVELTKITKPVKLKWRIKEPLRYALIGKRWTKWHEDDVDKFALKLKAIYYINKNATWEFQFKDFELQNNKSEND